MIDMRLKNWHECCGDVLSWYRVVRMPSDIIESLLFTRFPEWLFIRDDVVNVVTHQGALLLSKQGYVLIHSLD